MRHVEGTVTETANGSRWLTLEDIAWLLLFTILGFCQEEANYSADLVLVFWALFQVAEPKLRVFSTPRGQIAAISIKMLLSYLLVGYAHAINSSFYVIFLLPIISAATVLGLSGTVFFISLACVAYASFLFFVNWDQEYIPAPEIRLLGLRISFFPVVGLLVYQQARAKRREMQRTKAAAEELARSNLNLRKTQASLRRSERLAALGQLTAGLAHELRNPLSTIKASAELLVKPTTQRNPEVVGELAGYIASEVDRTNALVSRFLDFARPLELHAKPTDLREPVQISVRQVLARAEARQVDVQLTLPEETLQAEVDADLISVLVVNLIQNAIDACQPGGTVTVNLENRGEEACLTVKDNGHGIAPEHLESVFNPFFTTKSNGTGLGLALVAKIVDEHQGKISVHSEPGAGTAFEVTLSRASKS